MLYAEQLQHKATTSVNGRIRFMTYSKKEKEVAEVRS